MFDDDQWKVIVEKLQRITEAGTASWERYHKDYELEVGSTRYRLGSVDMDQLPPYFLRISDMDVQEDIDTLESEPVEEDERGNKVPANAAQLLQGLYLAVQRAVSGGPARFKALLEGLDQLDPKPF